MTHRSEVTQAVLLLLPEQQRLPRGQAERTWFYNIRNSGGFRLTRLGYQAFKMANMQSWSVSMQNKDITKSRLLDMDRLLQWPYYLDHRSRRIELFGAREAMMIMLMDGMAAYLDRRRREVGGR